MTKNIIGFGGIYYTGWQVTEDSWTDGNVRFNKMIYTYCQNLSKDLEEAKKKWQNAEVDMDLRGHKSFDRIEKHIKDGCFRFGRYEGYEYSVADGGYLVWYYENGAIDSEKATIEELLIENHGWVRMADGRVLSPESFLAEIQWEEIKKHTKELITDSSKSLSFSIASNLNEYGEVMVNDDSIELCIKFDNVKEMWYQGWPYYLPVDAKGKSKRIKNKTLVVNKWEVLSDHCIRPIEWEIIK